MIALLTTILAAIQAFVAQLAGRWIMLNAWVEGHGGVTVKWGMWILAAICLMLLAVRAARAAFNLTCFVLAPSAVLTVLLLVLMPCWSPMKTFPILMGITTFMLISRSR
jgi:hypothetical protein